jgi:RNA polymerase sigma factor (sigma-70 family)
MLDILKTETSLWEAFIAGDKEAYADLYRIYHPRLFNYGHKFTSDTELIEDCIQEIFIQFWMNSNKLSGVQDLHSYLYVSFRRRLLKALQRLNKHINIFFEEDQYNFTVDVSIEQVLIGKEQLFEQHIDLNEALKKLTGRQKEAIFLFFYENLSNEEVSRILSISKKATYKLVARALGELRSIYERSTVFLLSLILLFSLSFCPCDRDDGEISSKEILFPWGKIKTCRLLVIAQPL